MSEPNVIKQACPECGTSLKITLPSTQAVNQSKPQGLPLKGKIRYAWFGMGGICLLLVAAWFTLSGGTDASALAATVLLSVCGIFIPIYLAQRKTGTLELAVHRGWEWMGKLSWIGLISIAALQFSVPLLVIMLGLIIIGLPFLALNVLLYVRNRKPTRTLTIKQ